MRNMEAPMHAPKTPEAREERQRMMMLASLKESAKRIPSLAEFLKGVESK